MLAGLRCWEDLQALFREKFVLTWLEKVLHCCVAQQYSFNQCAEVLNFVRFTFYVNGSTANLIRFSSLLSAGELTRKVYEGMRREASSLRIQRDLRMHLARKAYNELCSSAISIQTGMRGMAARSELRFRRQTSAAIVIQVRHLRKT